MKLTFFQDYSMLPGSNVIESSEIVGLEAAVRHIRDC